VLCTRCDLMACTLSKSPPYTHNVAAHVHVLPTQFTTRSLFFGQDEHRGCLGCGPCRCWHALCGEERRMRCTVKSECSIDFLVQSTSSVSAAWQAHEHDCHAVLEDFVMSQTESVSQSIGVLMENAWDGTHTFTRILVHCAMQKV
jgi:hypothetical protein